MESVTMSNRNLYNLIHDAKFEAGTFVLTDKQKADIFSMVGKRCRSHTKARLSRMIDLPLALWEKYGIYSRVTLEDDGASYICGQSWNDEMATLRDCILNK
jgi:hypothetical protein